MTIADFHGLSLSLDVLALRVSRTLQSAAVPHTLIKGPTSARWLYDGSRPYLDVDLLVPASMLSRAVAELERAGIARRLAGAAGEEADHSLLMATPSGIQLDFHRSLPFVPTGHGRSEDLVWQVLAEHLEDFELFDGEPVPALDEPGRCLVLVLHALTNQAGSQADEDLRLARTKAAPESWMQALDVADRLGIRDLYTAGLLLSGEEETEQTLPPMAYLRRHAAPSLAVGLQRLVEATWTDRLILVARKAVPSPGFIRYSDPQARRGATALAGSYVRRWRRLLRGLPGALRALEQARALTARTVQAAASTKQPVVLLLSLENFDEVWRRNQHFVHQLLVQGFASQVIFVAPPASDGPREWHPAHGVTVVVPPLYVAPRFGGILLSALWLRQHWLGQVDLLWVNNAPLGRWLLGGRPAVHDVTDDWRESVMGWASRRRLIKAEGLLARRARTVVCSPVLASRWHARYGVTAAVIPNAVDASLVRAARPRELAGSGPHGAYVGTLHEDRLDVELVIRLASSGNLGTIHLVGPDHLAPASRAQLQATGNVRIHGPVPRDDVPSWLQAMDVLLLPHVVSPFTLGLDAIKAHEYLATQKPIVATPTSGFQGVEGVEGVRIIGPDRYVVAVQEALHSGPVAHLRPVVEWSARAAEFGDVLHAQISQSEVRAT